VSANPPARRRRQLASQAAQPYGGVLSRALLRGLGIDRKMVAREVAGDRWQMWGHQTVAVHTGPLGARALAWRAIWEVGARIAVLDGVSALQAAGLRNYLEPTVHVSVPYGCRISDISGIHLHHVRRQEGEVMGAGIPRTRPAVAAVRAAHWASSERQAMLALVMPVQQRLVTGPRLVAATEVVTGRGPRALIRRLAMDIADGAHSLGELDFAEMCRRRRLPAPSRQVIRHGPRGRVYLDVRWDDVGLVVEIDGSQHLQGLNVTDDNLRQNAITLQGDMVLRIDLVGLRIYEEAFLDQVEEGLRVGSMYQRPEIRAISPRLAVATVAG
jgi:very-short-patch-repair endonuclease